MTTITTARRIVRRFATAKAHKRLASLGG
jgi:hypothetical protein